MKSLQEREIIQDILGKLAVLGFSASISVQFFTQRRSSVFDVINLCVLLLARFISTRNRERTLPRSLLIWFMLYLSSYSLGAMISETKILFPELSSFQHVFIAGLLYTALLPNKDRKTIIVVLFTAAAISGCIGILQYFGLFHSEYPRPHGVSPHPILYAAMLAFICGSAVVMLALPNKYRFQSKGEQYFLLLVILLTSGGILLSGSRGVWLALAVACAVTLYILDRSKAMSFLLIITVAGLLIFSLSQTLRQRALSIVHALHSEDTVQGPAGSRFELWKGAWMIFKESPVLGTGIWDYQNDINRLIQERRIKNVDTVAHAHNIFIQALATRGLTGFICTIGFLTSLLTWGWKEIRIHGGRGGYIIVFATVITIIGGLSEDNIEITKYLAIFGLTIGLLGPLRSDRRPQDLLPH